MTLPLLVFIQDPAIEGRTAEGVRACHMTHVTWPTESPGINHTIKKIVHTSVDMTVSSNA